MIIRKLSVKNFKAFQRFDSEWGQFNLLVGANNSGKTSLFHALQFVFWLIEKTTRPEERTIHLEKSQVTDFEQIPHMDPRDLFFKQRLRSGVKPIRLEIEIIIADDVGSTSGWEKKIHFDIYQAYARNFMIDGTKSSKFWKEEFKQLLLLRPVYVPGFAGAVVKEDLYRAVSWNRMVNEGRHHEVLRNMIYEVSKRKEDWQNFVDSLKILFSISEVKVPFDEKKDRWLTATYSEIEGVTLDIVSAGAGFQQIVQLLAFLFVHKPKTLLLDEPDAHLHHSLQESVLRLLRNVTQKQGIQAFIATHSPTLIDSASLSEIHVIDKSEGSPKILQENADIGGTLQEYGISILNTKLTEVLRSERALFVENSATDYELFVKPFGEKLFSDFAIRCSSLVVLPIESVDQSWPFQAIGLFEGLVKHKLRYLYLRDKDFLTPIEVGHLEKRGKTEGKPWRCLVRRNRENYLLEPAVLSRLMIKKIKQKSRTAKLPEDVSEKEILNFCLEFCREESAHVRAAHTVQHETYIRADRGQRTQELVEDFDHNYDAPLRKGQIPHCYADGKAMLKALRTKWGKKYGIHFTDREIIDEFHVNEIASDVKAIASEVRGLFPSVPPTKAEPLMSAEK